jgi:hypothetical protein
MTDDKTKQKAIEAAADIFGIYLIYYMFSLTAFHILKIQKKKKKNLVQNHHFYFFGHLLRLINMI